MTLNVLVACEESQAVTKQFRALGHNAYSCDLLNSSGGNPEWHIKGDAIQIAYDSSYNWDLMIAHPPCTYLAVSGARWLYNKDGSRNEDRWVKQAEGLAFVRKLMDAPIEYIAIENQSVLSQRRYESLTKSFNPISLEMRHLRRLVFGQRTYPTLYTQM